MIHTPHLCLHDKNAYPSQLLLCNSLKPLSKIMVPNIFVLAKPKGSVIDLST